jgi:hypothetical protein
MRALRLWGANTAFTEVAAISAQRSPLNLPEALLIISISHALGRLGFSILPSLSTGLNGVVPTSVSQNRSGQTSEGRGLEIALLSA